MLRMVSLLAVRSHQFLAHLCCKKDVNCVYWVHPLSAHHRDKGTVEGVRPAPGPARSLMITRDGGRGTGRPPRYRSPRRRDTWVCRGACLQELTREPGQPDNAGPPCG